MALELFAHPFSSYCQKVLMALYENDVAFEYRLLGSEGLTNDAMFAAAWPLGKFPLLIDDGHPVMESSIIIEYLQQRHPGPARLIPDDPARALEARKFDRIFDNHVMGPMQRVVNDALRPPERRDPIEVEQARMALAKAYAWLDTQLPPDGWVTGDFSIAECAAAPALFYADWVHPIGPSHLNVRAYRARLLAHPSFARAVEEARPYRHYFPLGAPDRD